MISGFFKAPVPGIYHFQFSAVKDLSAIYLFVYLQVNGAKVGFAPTFQSATGSNDVVSLSASLRLVAGNTVNLWNLGMDSILLDDVIHLTHFSGWLVEEDVN